VFEFEIVVQGVHKNSDDIKYRSVCVGATFQELDSVPFGSEASNSHYFASILFRFYNIKLV
jgi:hypothetical protein